MGHFPQKRFTHKNRDIIIIEIQSLNDKDDKLHLVSECLLNDENYGLLSI